MMTETPAEDARFAVKETDYTALAAEHVAPCISIYLGSVGAERATERWLRVRNMLRAAESVHVQRTEERGDRDLLNVAAILALRHGGQVFVAAPEQLREGVVAAAVFRFPSSQSPA
jgi:hypothetical protein